MMGKDQYLAEIESIKDQYDNDKLTYDEAAERLQGLHLTSSEAIEELGEYPESELYNALLKNPDILDPDGHTIYEPKRYLEAGISKWFLYPLFEIYKSDTRSPKTTLFDKNENPIAAVAGIYNLKFLSACAHTLGCIDECQGFTGRGFQAQEYVRVIKQTLENRKQDALGKINTSE